MKAIEKIRDDLFCIKIPLPGTPLGNLNAYVLRSSNRHLIIDTGMPREQCRETLLTALAALNVDPSRCDIFLTHHHADHVGLVETLVSDHSTVYFHRTGLEILKAWKGFDAGIAHLEQNGFPKGVLARSLRSHPGNEFRCNWNFEPRFLSGGESIEIGDYHLQVTATPGHSPDHLCLYEPDRKILFSGDHILGDISPNIQCWNADDDPLKSFIESLKMTADMDVSLVLPAHRGRVHDHQQRIQELLAHHRERLDQILEILTDEPKTAYRVATEMTWDLDADSWDDFPDEQKWFATLEVIAHLKYLTNEGRLAAEWIDDGVHYRILPDGRQTFL